MKRFLLTVGKYSVPIVILLLFYTMIISLDGCGGGGSGSTLKSGEAGSLMVPDSNAGASSMKYTDELPITFAKCYGGSDSDYARVAYREDDGGFIIGGDGSSLDGDMTGIPRPSQRYNYLDGWLFKLDREGNILWNHCYGGFNID